MLILNSALATLCPLAVLAQAPGDAAKTKIERIQDAIRRRDLAAIPDFKTEADASARAWIARAAARLDPQGGLKVLEAALQDPAAEVRLAAAESLGQLGTAAAVADLAAALPGEKAAGVRQTMVFWLGASKAAAAVAAVSRALASDADANVRVEAAQALKRAGTRAAKKALKQAARDHDERVRKLAHD